MADEKGGGVIAAALETAREAAQSVAGGVRAAAAAVGLGGSHDTPPNPHAPTNARARRIAERLAKRAEKKAKRA